jgi:hypothetical protein
MLPVRGGGPDTELRSRLRCAMRSVSPARFGCCFFEASPCRGLDSGIEL